MTVLVGVVCEEGIVVGSDSSATFSEGIQHTIEQPTKKLSILGTDVIYTGAGQVGLSQRFEAIVDGYQSVKPNKNLSGLDYAKGLAKLGVDDFILTNAPTGEFGALVAFVASNKIHLCEFAIKDMQPELKTKETFWFVSMGSGQRIVDPFLGFMRKVFFSERCPNLKEGIFVVTWALQHVIELNPGGIKGPIQMAILEKNDGKFFKARLLDENELKEHQENVIGAETHFAEYLDKLAASDELQVPELEE